MIKIMIKHALITLSAISGSAFALDGEWTPGYFEMEGPTAEAYYENSSFSWWWGYDRSRRFNGATEACLHQQKMRSPSHVGNGIYLKNQVTGVFTQIEEEATAGYPEPRWQFGEHLAVSCLTINDRGNLQFLSEVKYAPIPANLCQQVDASELAIVSGVIFGVPEYSTDKETAILIDNAEYVSFYDPGMPPYLVESDGAIDGVFDYQRQMICDHSLNTETMICSAAFMYGDLAKTHPYDGVVQYHIMTRTGETIGIGCINFFEAI